MTHAAFAGCRGSCVEITVQGQVIFDALPDTIFQVNRSGAIQGYKLSKQYAPLIPSTEILGQHIGAILPPDFGIVVDEAIARTLETGEIQLFEYDFFQDNKTLYFEARISKAGEEAVLVIMRDTSEWRRFEACDFLLLDMAIKVQEERSLEEIITFACERIVTIFGVPLVWVACKEPDAAVKLFSATGKTSEYLQDNILRWDDSPAGRGITGAAIRTGKFQLMEVGDPRMLPWRERLSKYCVTTGAAFPLKVGGQILGALTVFAAERDCWTERTIVQLTNFAEQVALAIHVTTNRQSLKLLTAGLESAANAIVITSRNGDIQWANPAFFELNGYSATEVMRCNVRILESGQHSQLFYRDMWRYVLSGRIWQGEIINRRKDGSHYTAEMNITPVRDETGKITNFISIIQDVTARRQAEHEIQEAREAGARAERLSAMGVMAAGIAHEINQPLNSLKVLADGMIYWHKQGKIPEISSTIESIKEISKQADRIDTIIKHMRSFINNTEKREPALCDLNLAVEQSLELIGSQLSAHNIEVKTDLAANLPPILANSTQLEQIIVNFAVNAMQSLDKVDKPDKRINIVTGWNKGQEFLVFSDNGPGIIKAIKNKIFDPFFTTKSAGEGMGIGLSIIHTIVTSHGGKISVSDKPSGGAVFRVEFPVTIAKQKGVGTV